MVSKKLRIDYKTDGGSLWDLQKVTICNLGAVESKSSEVKIINNKNMYFLK